MFGNFGFFFFFMKNSRLTFTNDVYSLRTIIRLGTRFCVRELLLCRRFVHFLTHCIYLILNEDRFAVN